MKEEVLKILTGGRAWGSLQELGEKFSINNDPEGHGARSTGTPRDVPVCR